MQMRLVKKCWVGDCHRYVFLCEREREGKKCRDLNCSAVDLAPHEKQMIPRNVPYGSGCWMVETGFLVGLAEQREVRPDNQDHMLIEAPLCDLPPLSLSDRGEGVGVCVWYVRRGRSDRILATHTPNHLHKLYLLQVHVQISENKMILLWFENDSKRVIMAEYETSDKLLYIRRALMEFPLYLQQLP